MSKKNKEEKKQCGCHSEEETCHCHETEETMNECHCEEGNNECHCGEQCECHSEDKATNDLLTNRIKVLEDALLRSQAELLNYRKRKDEETQRILKYAEEDILKGFLPILDNFERAITMDDNNFGDETSKFLEGFRLVYNQTRTLLESFGVTEINSLNQEFDPAKEQAISTSQVADVAQGIVTQVYQKGYMYKDKVLRVAMVIVNE